MGRLLTKRDGMEVIFHPGEDGAEFVIEYREDVEDHLNQNKALQTAGHDGWVSDEKELRHAAHIPPTVVMKWMLEEGIDVYSSDPWHQKKVREKLNSSDYAHLRTAHFRL